MPKRKTNHRGRGNQPKKLEKKDESGSKKDKSTTNKGEIRSTLFRLSSRLESMKRRGTFTEPMEVKEEFEYLAEDCVTIRAPNKGFYLARILDDVTVSSNEINVAWFDKTAKNEFEVSYDDTTYKATIITKVHVKESPNESNTFYITPKSVKETKELLKETLENEGENYESPVEEPEADNDTEDTGDEEPSPKKKRRTSSQNKKKSPKKTSTPKITGGKRKRGLAPNSDIKLLDQDPKFVKNSTIPLAVERQAIKAVLTNDKKSLKNLMNDVKNVHSVEMQHSPHIKRAAVDYALLQEDLALVKMLYTDRKDVTAKQRNFDISRKETGKGDFRTFGHALRDVTVSRGNKEGDNAFLLTENEQGNRKNDVIVFCLKHNLSIDFIKKVMEVIKFDVDALISSFHIPVQHGYLELAAEIVNIAMKKDGFGFNVLHQELLNHKTENLKPFKAASVTKKIYLGEKVEPLFCACINPNAKYIQEVFTVLPEFNFADGKGNRPAHYAAACTSVGPLKYLIARGVDPSLGNNKKVTPLMVAAKCNRPHNIKVLMECKINMGTQGDADEDEGDNNGRDGNLQPRVPINYKDRESLTALHYAAKKGHLESVKMLLNYEANADIKASAGKENMTPLGYAAAKGHYDVVKYLVENGAKPELHMRRNKNALMYACMNGHSRIVAYLLNIGANPNARDSSDNTPIHYAAAYGWHHCAQLLLQAGADANIANNWKTTPLSIALAKHYMEIGDLLLNSGVDVNFVDDHGCTILMKRLQENPSSEQLTVIKHLIMKYKADATKVDARNWNMLHYLAQSDIYPQVSREIDGVRKTHKKYLEELSQICLQICDMLVKAGTDVNGIDEDGETPLMNAIRRGNFSLVKALIDHGASVEAGCTKDKEKAIHFVMKLKDSTIDLSDYFKVKEEVSNCHLKTKQENELKIRAQVELVQLLLDSGANVNAIQIDQHSLFTFALKEKIFAICNVLLDDKNIDILMYKDCFGENILHMLGCLIDHKESLELLKKILKKVEFSAEFTNIRDHNGLTPLLVLASQLGDLKWKNYDEINVVTEFVDLLLSKCKADVYAHVEKEVRGEKIQRCPLGISVEIDAKDEGRVEEYKDFGKLGLMNVLHISAFVKMPGKILKRILESVGASSDFINQKDRHGRTPLHYDFIKGGFNTKILLEAGASPDILSENINADHKAPALILATRFLIDVTRFKIGVTSKAKQPETSDNIVYDIFGDSDDEMKDLDDDSDVDMTTEDSEDDDDKMDLDYEIHEDDKGEEENNDDEEASDPTSDPLKTSKKGDRPRFSNEGSLELMIKKCANVGDVDLDGRNAGHWVALMSANDERKISILGQLIKRGLDINVQDTKTGRSMLHYIALFDTGDYETTNRLESYLISQGSRLDIACKEGRYPLHYAFYNTDSSGKFTETSICDPMSLVNVFCQDLENKLNPSELKKHISHQDNYGDSPLHFGCQRGATISCMQLKQLGADDTIKNNDGNTPLALALKHDYHGTAMMLLQGGSNPYCDLITKVTDKQKKTYEQKVEKFKYKWDKKVEKPTDVIVSAFAYALRKDWKDLAYIMMEVSKLPMFDAIKASILENKLNLIWTLLDKHPNQKLIGVDENQQNSLHLLAANSYSPNYFDDEENYSVYFDKEKGLLKPLKISKEKTTVNLAKHFINAGMNVEDVDSNGATPLHLAAKDDFPLAIFLVKFAPNMINVCDNDGKTPLVYAMDVSTSLSERRKFIEYLAENGADVNVVYKECLDGVVKRNSLLHLFVKKRDELLIEERKDIGQIGIGCLQYLLNKGADVNTVVDGGTTPLMLAIRLNYKDVVNLLLKRKPQLNHQDKNGNSYLHACVQTMEYGSHENVELLKILLKAGVPVNLVNNFNETALDVAKKQKSGVMAIELGKKSHKAIANKDVTENVASGFDFRSKQNKVEVDYVKDSKLEIEQKIANVVKDVEDDVVQVDKHAKENLPGKVSLYCDPVNNRPYDASLLKVDLAWGSSGVNSFYKLQVIHQQGKGLWILFNRWGRENRGNAQHQQTPFDTPEEAVSEFKKIFRSKTGNDWSNYDSFEKKPKKYNLIRPERNPEKMKKYHQKVLETFPCDEKLPENQIDKDLLTFIKAITNDKQISKGRASYASFNHVPYGGLSSEQIDKALGILDKISKIIKEKDDTEDTDVKLSKFEELAMRSNDFYMSIPSSNFDIVEEVKLIFEEYDAERMREDIYDMIDVNYAYSLLLGAQHRMKEINPYDYCYSALNCRLETIAPECDEAKLISQYIYMDNDSKGIVVSAMFRVERDDACANNQLHNKRMLWHGTGAGNMLSILHYGLQIAHRNASYRNGSWYGDGIYFSHDFSMSLQYANSNDEGLKYVMLCEVALGDMYIKNTHVNKYPVKNTHSTWSSKKQIPDPEEHVTMPYGPVMMIGKDVDNPMKNITYEYNHQAVVYDPNQVRIRYIVQVKSDKRRGCYW